jgi:hypothetical protein
MVWEEYGKIHNEQISLLAHVLAPGLPHSSIQPAPCAPPLLQRLLGDSRERSRAQKRAKCALLHQEKEGCPRKKGMVYSRKSFQRAGGKGVKRVYFHPTRGKWQCQIECKRRKSSPLSCFPPPHGISANQFTPIRVNWITSPPAVYRNEPAVAQIIALASG